MRRFVRFTEAEDQQIMAMRAKNMATKAIARKMGRNPSSIHCRLGFLGLGNTNPAPRQYEPEVGADESIKVRKADKRFIRALAKAFLRGDHLPAAQRLAA